MGLLYDNPDLAALTLTRHLHEFLQQTADLTKYY